MSLMLDLIETELFKEGHGSVSVFYNSTGWLVRISWPHPQEPEKIVAVFGRGSTYETALENTYIEYGKKVKLLAH